MGYSSKQHRNPGKTPGSRRYKAKLDKAFKARCDDANAEHDRRTGGAKVVKPPAPAKWVNGPLGEDGKETEYVFTFGKYQGKKISEASSSYLEWLIGEEKIFPALRKRIVRSWFRERVGYLLARPQRVSRPSAPTPRPARTEPTRPGESA